MQVMYLLQSEAVHVDFAEGLWLRLSLPQAADLRDQLVAALGPPAPASDDEPTCCDRTMGRRVLGNVDERYYAARVCVRCGREV
jgi:hypothetical protein